MEAFFEDYDRICNYAEVNASFALAPLSANQIQLGATQLNLIGQSPRAAPPTIDESDCSAIFTANLPEEEKNPRETMNSSLSKTLIVSSEEDRDQVTTEELQKAEERDGLRVVSLDLPEAWTWFGKHRVRCLIDSGSQLNLMRAATALKLNIEFEEQIGDTHGLVGVTGNREAFRGTAWNVPVKIGEIVIPTHFRICNSMNRSVILGAPWCAYARLSMQYTSFGKVYCRIESPDGKRNIAFRACNPPYRHPQHVQFLPTGNELTKNE